MRLIWSCPKFCCLVKSLHVSTGQMALNRVSMTKINDRAEQDQTARMCRLILLYTLRNKRDTANGRISANVLAADKKSSLCNEINL